MQFFDLTCLSSIGITSKRIELQGSAWTQKTRLFKLYPNLTSLVLDFTNVCSFLLEKHKFVFFFDRSCREGKREPAIDDSRFEFLIMVFSWIEFKSYLKRMRFWKESRDADQKCYKTAIKHKNLPFCIHERHMSLLTTQSRRAWNLRGQQGSKFNYLQDRKKYCSYVL